MSDPSPPASSPPVAAFQRPWIDSPLFEEELAESGLSTTDRERARFYRRHGYLVVEGLFSDDLLDRSRLETNVLDWQSIAQGLERSPSYRLGRALTAPLRWLRR